MTGDPRPAHPSDETCNARHLGSPIWGLASTTCRLSFSSMSRLNWATYGFTGAQQIPARLGRDGTRLSNRISVVPSGDDPAGMAVLAAQRRLLSPLAFSLAVAIIGNMVHMFFDVFRSRPDVELLWVSAALIIAIYRIGQPGIVSGEHATQH